MQWNAVTWYSRLGAMVLFLGALPALAFYLGARWQEVREVSSFAPQAVSTPSPIEAASSTPSIPEVSKGDKEDQVVPAAPDKLIFRFGQSFGECVGYCESEITVTEEAIEFSASGWNDEPLPTVKGQVATDETLWKSLVAAADLEAIRSLPDEIGCPDCDDGGARWVSVSRVTASLPQRTSFLKKVTFEYDKPPAELKSLIDLLAPKRAELSKRFNDYIPSE